MISLFQSTSPISGHFTPNFFGEVGGAPFLTGYPVGTKGGYTVPDCKGLGMMGSEVSSIVNFFELENGGWEL